MQTLTEIPSLDYLPKGMMTDAKSPRQLAQLQMVRRLIEQECPEAVSWAVAYGSFVERLHRASNQTSLGRARFRLLIVTTMDNVVDACILLGDKVLAPVYLEFAKSLDVEIWTAAELKYAIETNQPVWRRIKISGLSVYGGVDAAAEHSTQSSI